MSAGSEAGTDRRGEARVRFDEAVSLRYELFREFLQENAANISPGGMFIRTRNPGKPGSELDFEIRLEDDLTLIQGRGEVCWVRREAGGPEAPRGMGIRFLELASESRELVAKIVAERLAAGLELFDLEGQAPRPAVSAPAVEGGEVWQLGADTESEAPRESVSAGDEPADASPGIDNLAALDPEVPAPKAPRASKAEDPGAAGALGLSGRGRSSPLRLVVVAVLSALVGAAAVVSFYGLWVQPSIDALEMRTDELAGSPGGPWQPPAEEPEPLAEPAAGARETVTAAAADALPSAEVLDTLRAWARAWSLQRADDYLAFYAAGFEPPNGLDRAAWEAGRRARIARPEWIRVALTHVEVEPAGADAAEVRFVQSYRSERYEDLVRKRLRLVREDGAWRIAAEHVAR